MILIFQIVWKYKLIFLENNPQIGVLGSQVEYIDQHGKTYQKYSKLWYEDNSLKWRLPFF